MTAATTGIRALLLTDVVGSTQLSEQLGDAAMAGVWAAHDRVARDLLPPWRGREIDKTDGMLLMFDRAADAVGYALDYHRALAALPVPLKARAGLHVGPVLLRENAPEDVARGAKPLEVDGLAKPTAARVMSLALGGQTLVTPEALADLGDEVPWRRVSHGHWMMKGVSEPVELFELGDEHSPFAAPPDGDKVYRVVRSGERWVPVKEIPNNLPHLATRFVGREKELAELKAKLPATRLITLLGMGGLGKTRLSLQVALESMPGFPGGAWFVDLSPIRDPALVVAEAARALDVAEEPGRPLVETLAAHLKPRRALLIFDNCEHLIDPAGELVHALLQAAPGVRVIASSREPLDVPGEQSYPVQPLPLPNRGDSAAALLRSTAARLFVDRVLAHRPDFELRDEEAADVADLVVRLEGIPLAIELAAARTRTLEITEINEGLRRRFDVLTGGSRRLQARQQTLRALVDWSYDMLREDEKRVFDRLGVFVGGFDLAAAQAVCAGDPVAADAVPELLRSLTEKSLAMHEDAADGERWRMLETIREYAREKLQGDGDEAAVAARHCEHFFAFAKLGRDGLDGAEQPTWLRRLEVEVDNLRAAMSLALAEGVDSFIAVKMSVALLGFWTLRGYASEGRNVVRAALALPSVRSRELAHAWALYVGAVLATHQGDHAEATKMLEQCLTLRRGLGDPVQVAATLSTLSLARLQAGDPAAAREGELEALRIFRDEDDRIGEAIGLLHLGQIAFYEGDDGRAAADFAQALAIAREVGYREVEGESELMLGQVALAAGNLAEAQARFDGSLSVCRDAEDRRGEANALRWLGKTALERGDTPLARRQLGDALRSFDAFEMREELAGALEDHVELAAADGRLDDAAALASAATQVRARLGLARPPRTERRWQSQLADLRAAMPAGGFDAAWQRGKRWENAEAVKAALAEVRQPAAAT